MGPNSEYEAKLQQCFFNAAGKQKLQHFDASLLKAFEKEASMNNFRLAVFMVVGAPIIYRVNTRAVRPHLMHSAILRRSAYFLVGATYFLLADWLASSNESYWLLSRLIWSNEAKLLELCPEIKQPSKQVGESK